MNIKSLKSNKLVSILLLVLIIFDLIFVYYNIIHGIGFGDAIYPISLCHNIINGNIPLVGSWSCYPGFIFLTPIIYFYKTINNGYIGVALYYKNIYFIFMLSNILIFYKLFQLKCNNTRLFNLSISVLINTFIYISCNHLSYSYIFIIINMYCTIIIYVYDKIKLNKIVISIIMAFLMFVMTLFYPTAFVIAILWTFIIFYKNFGVHNKRAIVVAYVLTGIILSLIYIFILIYYARGYSQLLRSVNELLNIPHNKWKMNIIYSLVKNIRKYWLFVLALFITYIFLISIGKKYLNNYYQINDSKYFAFMFVLLSLIYYLSSDQQNFILTIIMTISFFVSFCLLYIKDNLLFLRNLSIFLCFFIIPFYMWFVAPKFLGLTPNYKNDKYIDYGIYKGLYTNKDDYEFITNLEKDIKNYFVNIKPEICEVTVFPATYLMTDSKVIAPDTWDSMELHVANIESWVNERNIPIPIPSYPLTNYFEYFKIKPQYFVAVDYYVRDFKNNNHKYEINNFIDEYYYIDYEKEYNLSRLIIYRIK